MVRAIALVGERLLPAAAHANPLVIR